jgi:hypothetical protein
MSVRLSSAPRALTRTVEKAGWRGVAAGPFVAVVTLLGAVAVCRTVGLSVRDPDHVAAGYVGMVGGAVLLLVGVDIALRAGRSSGRWPSRAAMGAIRRDRWTRSRGTAVAGALLSFYVTYMAYRNLKGAVPLVRRGTLFDRQLGDVDRALFAGHDPARVLHSLLGTGLQTQVLSVVYVAFIVFLPLSLAIALVFAEDLPTTLFFATALSINWVLGAASYYLLPSLGPVYAHSAAYAALPHSEVTHLQQVLLDQRAAFLRSPRSAAPQAIAAFASLHIAMSFTAVATAHLLRLGRRIKAALWAWLVLTTLATVYLGWHYAVDDVAGIAIGAVALVLARYLTGISLRAGKA